MYQNANGNIIHFKKDMNTIFNIYKKKKRADQHRKIKN